MRTIEDLRMMQALPLKAKVLMTQQRIREWVREYGTDGIYISFSGDTDKLILKRLTEVKGTDEETTVLACMWRDGRLCALWRAYREYEASQSAVQMKLFL